MNAILIAALICIAVGLGLVVWQRGLPAKGDHPFGDPQNRRDRKWRSF